MSESPLQQGKGLLSSKLSPRLSCLSYPKAVSSSASITSPRISENIAFIASMMSPVLFNSSLCMSSLMTSRGMRFYVESRLVSLGLYTYYSQVGILLHHFLRGVI